MKLLTVFICVIFASSCNGQSNESNQQQWPLTGRRTVASLSMAGGRRTMASLSTTGGRRTVASLSSGKNQTDSHRPEVPVAEETFETPTSQKLFIVTDPETGSMIYIPANLFFERLGGLSWRRLHGQAQASVPTATPRNPFICDLFTRNCWLAGNRPTQADIDNEVFQRIPETPQTTRRPGGGSTIFGHPDFHQGAFPETSTTRPFRPFSTGNRITTTPRPIDEAPTVASRGGGGGAHIFGHPTFHQGESPTVTTSRPFRPWNPSAGEDSRSNTLSSSDAAKSGRRKRSIGYSSSSSSSASKGNFDAWSSPHFPNFANVQENYFKNMGGSGIGGFPGGYPGGFPNGFPAGAPDYGYNNHAYSHLSASPNVGHNGHGVSQTIGVPGYKFGPVGTGTGYSVPNYNRDRDEYGDNMQYSTQTTKDGMIQTKMEGSKCDAHGCKSSSSSVAHMPDSGHSTQKSSGYETQTQGRAGIKSYETTTGKHYTYSTTTTKKPYTYSTSTTPRYSTAKSYTYSTTRQPHTYSTTTRQPYTYSTTRQPYTYSTTIRQPYTYSNSTTTENYPRAKF